MKRTQCQLVNVKLLIKFCVVPICRDLDVPDIFFLKNIFYVFIYSGTVRSRAANNFTKYGKSQVNHVTDPGPNSNYEELIHVHTAFKIVGVKETSTINTKSS